MEYLDHPFDVSTGSSRRPTPLAYQHLRDYPALVKQYLRLSSHTDIVNVNDILDLVGNLYVSNEISRVIAQIVGEKDPGFITIKGTADGALHVYPAGGSLEGKIDILVADGDNVVLGAIADDLVDAGAVGTLSAKLRRVTQGLEDLKTLVVLATSTNTIGNVKIAGPPQPAQSEDIHISGTGDKDIILADGTKSHYITSIMFTVAAETDITLKDNGTVTSGPMNFGGTGEPMGLTHNFGFAPLVCGAGKKFQINLGVDVAVEGLVTYYSE